MYREGWYLNARDQRAVSRGSPHGHQVVAGNWSVNEFEMLRRAWRAGANVPYPVERTDDGVLMEYVGDASRAAPRLVNAGLSGDALHAARDQLLDNVAQLTGAQIVHADLSVYNLLWWDGRLVLIDFPQAVDATTNPSAAELLYRDLSNVADWFGRRGARIDVETAFAELVVDLVY